MIAGVLLALAMCSVGESPGIAEPHKTVYVVIASPDVPISGLTLAECRRIFLFEKTMWKSGLAITVMLPERRLPARSFLLRHIYRMNDAELRRLILERVFQGRIDLAPKASRSDEESIGFVASARGLISLVPASAQGLNNVRVLRIDGKLPSDHDYRLSE